jgi:hypothetical protein
MSTGVAEKEFISTAFARSLDNLGINSSRYQGLPRTQRKLALCEAIQSTTMKLLPDFEPLRETGLLSQRRLEDFSPEQVFSHRVFLDANIALACLGETAVIRYLINYLSFPEPRWRILIEPVLRSLCRQPPRGHLGYHLPKRQQVLAWCEWALTRSETIPSFDFSVDLLSEGYVRHKRAVSTTRVKFVPWIESWTAPEFSCKYFYSTQAEFAESHLEQPFERRDFHQVVKRLDGYIRANQSHYTSFATLSAALHDFFCVYLSRGQITITLD